jgi:transcriptional regulator with XRE-family HTH domain
MTDDHTHPDKVNGWTDRDAPFVNRRVSRTMTGHTGHRQNRPTKYGTYRGTDGRFALHTCPGCENSFDVDENKADHIATHAPEDFGLSPLGTRPVTDGGWEVTSDECRCAAENDWEDGQKQCLATGPAGTFCAAPAGHDGPHVACNPVEHPAEVWDRESGQRAVADGGTVNLSDLSRDELSRDALDGSALREIREQAGCLQADVAGACDWPTELVHRAEKTDTINTPRTIEKVANALERLTGEPVADKLLADGGVEEIDDGDTRKPLAEFEGGVVPEYRPHVTYEGQVEVYPNWVYVDCHPSQWIPRERVQNVGKKLDTRPSGGGKSSKERADELRAKWKELDGEADDDEIDRGDGVETDGGREFDGVTVTRYTVNEARSVSYGPARGDLWALRVGVGDGERLTLRFDREAMYALWTEVKDSPWPGRGVNQRGGERATLALEVATRANDASVEQLEAALDALGGDR